MPKLSPSKSQAINTALLGNWQNATSINKALLHDNPNDIEALNRLAFALAILGKIKNAKAAYRKVLKIDALNPIAIRNIKRLSKQTSIKNIKNAPLPYVNRTFLEETGKTKIVCLVNIAQPKIVGQLTTGQLLTLSIKRSKIFIQDKHQYIGVLPDDIGKRLIKFIKGGNQYEAYVKLATDNRVVIFIKEIKRVTRFKDQPSFLHDNIKSLSFEKGNTKPKSYKVDYQQEEQKNSLQDEEKDGFF